MWGPGVGSGWGLLKTQVWGPGVSKLEYAFPPSAPLRQAKRIPWGAKSGTTMLGVPIHFPGDPTCLREAFSQRLLNLQQVCASMLCRTRDPQTQLALLRGCFSACRFTFLSRATCSFFAKDILFQAENVMRETLEHSMGTALSDPQWLQCTLSPNQGGLGIDSPHTQAPAAAIAGLVTWLQKGQEHRPRGVPPSPLLGTPESLQWLRSVIGPEIQPLKRWAEKGSFVDFEVKHGDQNHCSGLIHHSLRLGLLQDCQARESIRLRCQDSASCSPWSRAPPSSALGTKIPRDKFQTIFRWHAGIMVLNPAKAGTGATACQRCGDALDAFGDHAVSCT